MKKKPPKLTFIMSKQTPFSLLVYSTRTTDCIYHKEWQQQIEGTSSKSDREHLLFGLLFSLRRTSLKLSPNEKPSMFSTLTTSGYKLHFYQTATGYMFILLTPTTTKNYRKNLINFFSQIFLPHVVLNPLYDLDTQIKIPSFDSAIDTFDFLN